MNTFKGKENICISLFMFWSRLECSRKATSPRLLPLGLPTRHLVQKKTKEVIRDSHYTTTDVWAVGYASTDLSGQS